MIPTHEKRRFVRINDRVMLAVRTIAEAEKIRQQQKGSPNTSHQNLATKTLGHQLKEIDDQLKLALFQLADKMPKTAATISLLHKKVDLITHHILRNEISEEHKEVDVSLSAVGLGFSHHQPYNPESHIALDIMLSHNPYRIITASRVVSCAANTDDNNYYLRTEFMNLSDEDEEIVIQHVLMQQTRQLKQQRLDRESSDESEPNSDI